MAKVRVFEAAKDHDLDVQDLLNALNQLGVKVRSHLSPVEEEEVEQAITSLGKKKKKPARVEEKDAAASDAPKLMVRRRKKSAEEADATEEGAEPVEETSPEESAAPVKSEPAAPAVEEAAEAPVEAAEEEASEMEAAEAAPDGEAAAKASEKPAGKPAAKEAEKPAAQEAEAPAAAAGEEGKKEEGREFGLKVVRFIRPEERPEAFAPAAAAYPMTKQEREAQKAERKAKKKRNKREERVEQKRAAEKTKITVPKAIKRRIRISEVITVSDLAHRMGVKATEVIKSLMGLGILATINQILDVDTATLVAGEFGYEIENIAMAEEEMLQRTEDRPEDLQPRPPVITVMGHVDHGKTSLLDAIRKTKVAAGESGGITQHIGAYKVETSRGTLVFLDTPGHEAFTEMRARGAKATDIVVLVVAANDGVMPQTVEAIHHAKAAEVPIMVAVNKMDLPDANPDRVRRELSEHGLISEDWGGETVCVPLSAKQGTGIEDLLEMIALQAEMMNLQANPEKAAAGIVVEARLDRGRGPVATVLVQEGTLNLGDIVLSGRAYGRIRSLTNDVGRKEKKATPGIPVEITGLSGVPQAGDNFVVVETERTAKEISERRIEKTREAEMAKIRRVSLDDLHTKIAEGEMKTLCIIVKADVQGSVEAVSQSLEKLTTDQVRVNVIHKGVGGIIESDVQLAIASEAIIVGFHVRPESKAAQLADHSGVDIRLYDVIYDATDDVKRAMTGMLAPRLQEKRLGRVEVRQTFKVPKVGTVAGCYVRDGIVNRNAKLRIVRDNVVIYEGTLSSLKRFKDDIREVREGLECGLSVQDYNDLKVGDEIEFYQVEEVAQTL